MALGMRANAPAQASLLDFSPLLALWPWTPAQARHPAPGPQPQPPCGPLLHKHSEVVAMAITASGTVSVPFGTVTCLPVSLGFSWLGDGPVDSALPFLESQCYHSCGPGGPVAHCIFQTATCL